MILTCPSCGTQYALKEGAIPANGRKVRCAACGTSWHQLSEADVAEPQPEVVEQPAAAASPDEAPEPQAPAEPAMDPARVEPPLAVPVPDPDDDQWGILPQSRGEREFDPAKEVPDAAEIWAVEDESETDSRRNWWRGLIIGLVLVAVLAAVFWFLAPDSLRRGVGLGAASTPLQITAQGDRQMLASGNELLAVSGRIINPSDTNQPVPPIQAQIRDASGRILHSWTIAPPARSLAPGASASFNSAEMDVPAGGDQLTVTLGGAARG